MSDFLDEYLAQNTAASEVPVKQTAKQPDFLDQYLADNTEPEPVRRPQDVVAQKQANWNTYVEDRKKGSNGKTDIPAEPSTFYERVVSDPIVSGFKGMARLPESAVGLLDIPTMGYAGKIAKDAGADFEGFQKGMDNLYSEDYQKASKNVAEAKGLVGMVNAMINNPSTIVNMGAESIPLMIGGGLIGRGITKVLPKVSPYLAGAAGEGITAAGSGTEQVRQQTESGLLTPEQVMIQTASGAATGIIGALGGKVSQKLGIDNLETLLSGGNTAEGIIKKKNIVMRAIASAITEGAFEELPQSMQEQIAQNKSLGRPWDEGVWEAAAQGGILGSVIGAFAPLISNEKNNAPQANNSPDTIPPTPIIPPARNRMPANADFAEGGNVFDERIGEQPDPTQIYDQNGQLRTDIEFPQQGPAFSSVKDFPATTDTVTAEPADHTQAIMADPTTETADAILDEFINQGTIGGVVPGTPKQFVTPPPVNIPVPPPAENIYMRMDIGQLQEVAGGLDGNGRGAPVAAVEAWKQRQGEVQMEQAPAPVAQSIAEQSEPTPEATITLPKELSGAKPRYNYASKAFQLEFEDDIDKASFIASQKTKSKRDAEYLDFAMKNGGMTADEVIAHGNFIRNGIKASAIRLKGGSNTEPQLLKLPKIERKSTSVKTPKAPKKPTALINIAKSYQERWDSSKLGYKVELVKRAGWITSKKELTSFGEKTAESKWTSLSPAAKGILMREIGKDYPELSKPVAKVDEKPVQAPAVKTEAPAIDLKAERERTAQLEIKLKADGYTVKTTLPKSEKGEKLLMKQGYMPYLMKEDGTIGTHPLGTVWAKAPKKAVEQEPVKPKPETIQTIAGNFTGLDDFEKQGYTPDQVTQEDWVNLMRLHMRSLGQKETGDNPNAPYADYEEYHKQVVKDALAKGEEVDPQVLEGYPELTKKPETAVKKLSPENGNDVPIGKNADGFHIKLDDKGARYYVKNGIRITQAVGLIPTKTGLQAQIDGVETLYRRGRTEFLTVEELKQFEQVEQKPAEAKKPTRKTITQAEYDAFDQIDYVDELYKAMEKAGLVTDSMARQYRKATESFRNGDNDAGYQMKSGLLDQLNRMVERQPKAAPVTIQSPVANLSPEKQAKLKELQDKLRKQTMGRVSAGLDPEALVTAAQMAQLYAEGGIKTFKQFAQVVKADMADAWDSVKAYLHSAWQAAGSSNTELDDVSRTEAKGIIDEIDGQRESAVSPLRDIILNNDSMMKKTTTLSLLAKKQGITVKQIQEQVEVEIVRIADEIARDNALTTKQKFEKIVALYEKQPNLNMRTSTSIENQAYSTPAPLAFALSDVLGVTDKTALYEPTAGNGMLAIGSDKNTSEVNELNRDRAKNLGDMGFVNVSQEDATKHEPSKKFSAVIMNPPFGKIPNMNYNGFSITKIDNLIALKALEAMKHDGKAAIILGAKREAGAGGQGADWIFKNYLYGNYNVIDNFEIDGDLYRKQGAAFPVQVIIIAGRKVSPNVVKITPKALDRLTSWDSVFTRVQGDKNEIEITSQALDVGQRPVSDNSMAVGQLPDAQGLAAATTGSGINPKTTGKPGGRRGNRRGESTASGQSGTVNAGLPAGQSAEESGNATQSDEYTGGTGVKLPGVEVGTERSTEGTVSDTGRSETGVRGTDTGELFGSDSVKESEFQSPYKSASKGTLFDSLIPKSIANFVHSYLKTFISENGRPEDYLASRLKLSSEQIKKVMAAEQIDGVAMAIKQIEDGDALIIGDETGLGKGRQAAAVIRYAKVNGKIPIFFTQDPKLFSDMFRDITDIGTQIKPLILGEPSKSTIVDMTGDIKVKALPIAKQKTEIARILKDGMDKSGYDSILLTYSQIRDEGRRQDFLEELSGSEDVIIILDEAHNAAGDAETSMQAAFISGGKVKRGSGPERRTIAKTGILNMPGTKRGRGGVLYLSATWAKRPENLPVFFRTAMSRSARNFGEITNAVKQGGVALQQALTEALAQMGQYIRREKDFSGVTFDTKAVEVKDPQLFTEKVDSVSDVLSRIVSFSHDIKEMIKQANKDARSTAMSQTQIDVTEFAAIVHNQIGQLLLSAKADAVVEDVIKEKGKPIVALMNTMESFLEQYATDHDINNGDKIQLRWNELLEYALSRTLRTTEKDASGEDIKGTINPSEIGMQRQYNRIMNMINEVDVSFPVSPIDYIVQKCSAQGKKLVELTGRQSGINYTNFETGEGIYHTFKKVNKNKAVNGFNNGDYDGMLMNASGSTGLSLHATPKNGKDVRQRHMMVVQPSSDINVFVQTLGRIKRTGMIPGSAKYTHYVLPLQAELRPAAMTSKKMKSLNANLTADAEGTVKIQSEDFLNKYGDIVVANYLSEHEDLQSILNLQPLQDNDGNEKWPQDLAKKFTGRMALRPDEEQKKAYSVIIPAYREFLQETKNSGEYDLEIVTHDDWDATPLSDEVLRAGTDESNLFTSSVRVQQWEIRDKRHVPTGKDMADEIRKNIGKSKSEFVGKFNDRITEGESKYGSELSALRAVLDRNPDDEDALLHQRRLGVRKARFDNMVDQIRRLMNHLGSLRDISKDHGEMATGVIVDIVFPDRNLFETTPSTIKIKAWLHVPGGKRTFALSQITSGDIVLGATNKTYDEINEQPKNNRYPRFFVTGNPVSSYIATGNKGKMVRFVTREGKVITGLEMPNNWNTSQLASDPRLELVNGKAVKKLFDNHLSKLGSYRSPMTVNIGRVTIMKAQYREEYTIQVPGSRRASGDDIYLDAKIRRLTHSGEFTKHGSFMESTFPPENLVKLADMVSNIMGKNFTVNSDSATDIKVTAVQDANGTTRQHQTIPEVSSTPITVPQANLQLRRLASTIGGNVTGMLGKVGSKVTLTLKNGFTITIEAMDSIKNDQGQTAGGFIERTANGYRVGYSVKDGRLTTIPHEALGHVAWNALSEKERAELHKFLGTTTDEQAVEKLATMWTQKPDGIKGMAYMAWTRFKRIIGNVAQFFGMKVDEGRRLAEDVVSGKISDRIVSPVARKAYQADSISDAAYLKAVESGDMETAQKMVEEEARRKGYAEKAYHGTKGQLERIDNNKPLTVEEQKKYNQETSAIMQKYFADGKTYLDSNDYNNPRFIEIMDNRTRQYDIVNAKYGQGKGYDVIRLPFVMEGINLDPSRSGDVGVHFSENKNTANKFATNEGKIFSVFLRDSSIIEIGYDVFSRYQGLQNALSVLLDKQIVTDKQYGSLLNIAEKYDAKDFTDERDWGQQDGVIKFWQKLNKILISNKSPILKYYNEVEGGGYSYAVFNQKDIKSADPVIYDDKGEVIPLSERFNEKSKDIRYQTLDDGNKTMQYAERSAEDVKAEDPELAKRILANPEVYYKPMNLKDSQEFLAGLSDAKLEEVINRYNSPSLKKNDRNLLPMALMEKANRQFRKGDDSALATVEAANVYHGAGQMLVQARLLKTTDPVFVENIIEKEVEKAGRKLTPDQKTELTKRIKKEFDSRDKLQDAETEWEQDFENKDKAEAVDRARKEYEQYSLETFNKIKEVTPKSLSDIFVTALQGNLLSPISQVANIFGNLSIMPLLYGSQHGAAIVDAGIRQATGKQRTVLNPWTGNMTGLKYAGRGLKQATKQFWTGNPTDYTLGDQIRGFSPLRAWVQGFTGKDMAVDVSGKVPLTDRAKKLIEAFLGTTSEPMLRMLSFGDLPFKGFAYGRAIAEIGAMKGLKGVELQKFIEFPDSDSMEKAMTQAKIAVFQEDNKMATIIQHGMRELRETPVIGGPAHFAAKGVLPYVKTPANLAWEGLQFLSPELSLIRSIYFATQGKRRDSLIALGKAGVGQAILTGAAYLIANGLVSPPPDKDKKKRELEYATMPPGSFNVSGFARLIKGDSPAWRAGDETRSYSRLGFAGMIMQVMATRERKARIEWAKTGTYTQYAGGSVQLAGEALPAVLSMTSIKGTNDFLSALMDNKMDKWFASYFRAVSSVALPNTLSALNRTTMETIPEASGNSLKDAMANALKTRLWMYQDLPSKRDILGRPIKSTPDSSTPWFHQLFDITKGQNIPADPVARKIWKLFQQTGYNAEAIPSIPDQSIRTPRGTAKLTDKQYERFIELVGQERMRLLANINQNMSVAGKLKAYRRIYERGLEVAKMKFLREMQGQVVFVKKQIGKVVT